MAQGLSTRKTIKLLTAFGLLGFFVGGLTTYHYWSSSNNENSKETAPSEQPASTASSKATVASATKKPASTISTPIIPLPAKTSLTAYSTKEGLILEWNKVSKHASGYEIQYSTDASFQTTKTIQINDNQKTSEILKNLKAGTTYYLKIRVYNEEETQKVYSDFSKTVSMSTAGAVTFFLEDGFYAEELSAATQKRMIGKSYKENEYIKLSDLRYIRVFHYDYEGNIKSGELVVNKKISERTVRVFYELYKIKYPIQRMQLIDDYNADDDASMTANNTSGFNFRLVANTTHLSNHAYGMAIDINPRINPYITSAKIYPDNGVAYAERDVSKCTGKYKDNMIHKGDAAYNIFINYGFSWGGNWYSPKDYQHFEVK